MSDKHEPHRTKKLGRLPWVYCTKCGLVYLHNEVTARAIKAPCEGGQ